MIESFIVGIYTSELINIRDINNTLNLLKYYNRVFFNDKLSNIIIYGIDM